MSITLEIQCITWIVLCIHYVLCIQERNGGEYLYPEKYMNDGNASWKGLNFTFEWKERVMIWVQQAATNVIIMKHVLQQTSG